MSESAHTELLPLSDNWYEDHNLLMQVGYLLAKYDYFGLDDDAAIGVLDFIDTPQKHTTEARRVLSGIAPDEDFCPECHKPGIGNITKNNGEEKDNEKRRHHARP